MQKILGNKSINSLRKIAQKLGLGKALLQFYDLKSLTLKGALNLNLAKSRYLKKILMAKPIPAGEGAIEVHMLLHHKRIYEGLWALYSFAYFCGKPCQIVVHNDGSLTDIDLGLLNQLLPQSQVIDRETANSVVLNYFHQAGLIQCAEFREKLIFALKLFDPFFFCKNRAFILLDSDVLFFSRPQELLDGIEANENTADITNLYSVDNSYRYSLQSKELATLLGKNCIERFNPGVLRACQGTLDFTRIEQYLQCKDFWNEDGTANYYAELTLWAMELTRANAFPLPNTYAICPNPESPNLVSGHYCGGGYWASLFYTRGLPQLASIFLG